MDFECWLGARDCSTIYEWNGILHSGCLDQKKVCIKLDLTVGKSEMVSQPGGAHGVLHQNQEPNQTPNNNKPRKRKQERGAPGKRRGSGGVCVCVSTEKVSECECAQNTVCPCVEVQNVKLLGKRRRRRKKETWANTVSSTSGFSSPRVPAPSRPAGGAPAVVLAPWSQGRGAPAT